MAQPIVLQAPLLVQRRHEISSVDDEIVVSVQASSSIFNINVYFHLNDRLIFSATQNREIKLISQEYIIYSPYEIEIGRLRKKSIYEREEAFSELELSLGERQYQVKFSYENDAFQVINYEGETIASGTRIGEDWRRFLGMRTYWLNPSSEGVSTELWGVVLKGIQMLMG
ncbi:hypothetical protein N781_11505 [Pontibacillus halophilus JSM 076056 = DSM 19796]|uniref:Uncharacterized protein n=1 Tax=Pontibacillus halophilus JSM 076056 = DSM 19796 TaxID=1385510 RepID=A0A0A5G7V2_9BACI|nr:hypothetical protein [Pontibacillus halophilus]KGX88104.1 hypothetical protein N781_11505 [Pontibacillus halophilus JSM 076056 = DSM 19796]